MPPSGLTTLMVGSSLSRHCMQPPVACIPMPGRSLAMRAIPVTLILLVGSLLFPLAAHAQATLAGTVRDPSGAVLPGVTVEAASPALIEKVRTAVTDSSGQYRITELPPGTYSLTFSLSGFGASRREGVTVAGSGVIPISID